MADLVYTSPDGIKMWSMPINMITTMWTRRNNKCTLCLEPFKVGESLEVLTTNGKAFPNVSCHGTCIEKYREYGDVFVFLKASYDSYIKSADRIRWGAEEE